MCSLHPTILVCSSMYTAQTACSCVVQHLKGDQGCSQSSVNCVSIIAAFQSLGNNQKNKEL